MDRLNTQPENIKKLSEILATHFTGNNIVTGIKVYKDVLVYLTVKNNNIHFALDVYLDSTIDLVFRNEETRNFYSEYFKYNFDIKNNILGKEEVLNKIFKISAKNIPDIVEEIISFLVSIENDSSIYLRKIAENVLL